MGRLTAAFFAFAATTFAADSWPCVSRKAPDRSYIEVAEASGGQVILATPGEIEKTTFLHIQRMSHRETVFRSTGELFNETREFRFPVDPSISSLLISVMLACKGEITILTGQGTEPIPEPNEAADLKGGRILRIQQPAPGEWTLRLRGNLFYSIVVEAATSLAYSATPPTPDAQYRLTGEEGQTLLRLGGPPPAEPIAGYPRYRIALTGTGEQGFPYQRLTRQMILPAKATQP